MNLYTTPTAIRTLLGLTITQASDSLLTYLIEGISRSIDRACHRHFYTREETKTVKVDFCGFIFLPDLLRMDTLSALGSYGGTATSLTIENYVLYPLNEFPRTQIKGQPLDNVGFLGMEFIELSGLWGYGDGESAAPWATSLPVIPSLAIDAVSKVLVSVSGYEVGQTYLLTTDDDTEQIYITGVNTDTLTITMERGVNGTTAVAHTDATVQRALYPGELNAIVNRSVSRHYGQLKMSGVKSEKMDEYSVTFNSVAAEGVVLGASDMTALKESRLVKLRRFF